MKKRKFQTTIEGWHDLIGVYIEIDPNDLLQERIVSVDHDSIITRTESVEEQLDNMSNEELKELVLTFLKENI